MEALTIHKALTLHHPVVNKLLRECMHAIDRAMVVATVLDLLSTHLTVYNVCSVLEGQ